MNVPKKFYKLFLAGSIVLALLIVTWWCVWTLAVLEYQHVIDHIIDEVRGDGYEISYDDRRAFGFPNRVALRLTNLHWKNSDNIEFHTDDIDISSVPWMWRQFDARFKNGATLEAPLETGQQALHLSGNQGRAHVELDTNHNWRLGRIELTGAKLGRKPDTLFLVGDLILNAERPLEAPSSHMEAGLTLIGKADNIDLPNAMAVPFGAKMERLKIKFRVMGAVPDVRRRSDIEAWNKESGVVEFDQLDMTWGPLGLKARGTMGLDDDLQPEGAFSGNVLGHEAVLKALMEGGFIAPRQYGMLSSALAVFAHSSDSGADAGLEIPITVQLGGLFLGPVRIITFPEIFWQQGENK